MGVAQVASAIADPSKLLGLFAPGPKLIDSIQIDLIIDESVSYDFDITEHPVEAGLDVTDYRIARPFTLTLDCEFMDVAFDPLSLIGNAISGNLSFDTWRDKKDALYKLKDENKVINVATPLHLYYGVMITSISPSVNVNTGNCFQCRIEFKEVRMVATAIADIDPSTLPPDLQATAKANAKKASAKAGKGAQSPSPAGTKGASILATLAGV